MSAHLYARLLQVCFVLNRWGAVRVIRDGHDCRLFGDFDEAMDFVRGAIDAGSELGIAWPRDDLHTYDALAEFAGYLAQTPKCRLDILRDDGVEVVEISRDDLPFAASVIEYVLLNDLHATMRGVG